MKQTPCEHVVWYWLPLIRKYIAESMINKYGLSQKETAEKLCITPAAVSQYLNGKRGKITINNIEIIEEINSSAEVIIKQGDKVLVSEMCRLCDFFSSKRLFPFSKIGNSNKYKF
jgi:predicted transcriptional regulator